MAFYLEHAKVWTISSYKPGCDPLQLRRAARRNSGVYVHEIPDRGGAAAPRGSRIINLEGAEPEGIQHALAVPTSPFSLPLLLLSLVHHHSWDVRRGGPRTHFDITQGGRGTRVGGLLYPGGLS